MESVLQVLQEADMHDIVVALESATSTQEGSQG